MEDVINKLDGGLVQHIFEITQDGHTYRDALVMPQADYDVLTVEQIATMKQGRFDNWLAVINAPPAVEAPVEEQPAIPQ